MTREEADDIATDVNLRESLYALNRAISHVDLDSDLKAITKLRDETWQLGAKMFGWKD